MTIERIKNYLEQKITGSWYVNAEIDYGVTGKFLDAEIIGNDLKIIWEEMGLAVRVCYCMVHQRQFRADLNLLGILVDPTHSIIASTFTTLSSFTPLLFSIISFNLCYVNEQTLDFVQSYNKPSQL